MSPVPPRFTGKLSSSKLEDLEAAWAERLQEAESLAKADHRLMALAMKVYCLEIRLKTIICHTLKLEFLPDGFKTRDLDQLLVFTGLWKEINDPANEAIKMSWDDLANCSRHRLNDLRYRPVEWISEAEIATCEDAFANDATGVWAWLSRPR